jgi:hypothetical protein
LRTKGQADIATSLSPNASLAPGLIHRAQFLFTRIPPRIIFQRMSIRGSKTGPSLTKVEPRAAGVSPDDVLHLMKERDRLAATDTRTDLEKYFGDPPAWGSALAQRNGPAE